MEGHLCYLRATPAKEHYNSKFIFFFILNVAQDELLECENGYVPNRQSNCKDCQSQELCNSCSKCQHCKSSWCGKATHRPNFVVAHTVCPKCIDEPLTPEPLCKKCGTRCDECDNSDLHDNEDPGPCPQKCGFREVTFEGDNTAEKFGEWVFSPQHEYFKVFAHNMKGYDGYFLLEYLIDQSLRPDKMIYSGSKIMYMAIESDLHIKVIDSLNFLPMKLSALPKAFGLTELKKGWFPHYFNTSDNQTYVGPYPDAKKYGHNFMSEKERAELLVWLNERKDDVFNFRKEMLDYCRSDVQILRQACLKFRELLMSATGERIEVVNEKGKKEQKWVGAVDPFDSVTIASVCMNVFRTKFLEEEWKVKFQGSDDWIPSKLIDGKLYVLGGNEWILQTKLTGVKVSETEFVRTPIAKIPPTGYNDQYSEASIQWLEYMACTKNVKIQHALNKGEKSLPGTRYKLDGYCEETNTAYEFNGCVFHACLVCFPDNREETRHPLTKQSFNELYALTMKKKAYIEQLGMKYVCIWEHEFKKQKSQNPELKQFVESLDLIDRLDPRESFFGGRTNASQLYYKTKERAQIRYVDFTSLYPWVNKYCQYPEGHPTVITKDFKDMKDYFGIAKVKILPPRGLYHPVLPYKSNNKLKFPLCRTCADTENPHACACSEQERELTGTWCTPEIQKAIKLGYQIKKIYEVYHWEKSTQYDPKTGSGGLFANYINTFLKFKQEASGFPDWINNEQDRTDYVSQYLQKEGVLLCRANISKNPGLRALAKLCLNSFWGKFGQRLNMRQTEFFHEVQANLFFQLFCRSNKRTSKFSHTYQ
ncbi:uncharacterized protein LOC132730933 [Ruditapes philippinarum]|uniref:uncharacterized protein LOC132730933 n=1 Tax=Ruditapes philippinarum TaxID=129788 RepID=UPI00295B7DAB|nr:uncharacterized protein LOC132730933 [Ruditapes philippinarum]